MTRAIEAFRHRKVRVVDGFPFRTYAATGRAAVLRARRASRRIDIVDLAMIRVGIKLRPRQLHDRGRDVVAQLAEHRPATVAEQLRGIERAAEEAPAVGALFGYEQRRKGVLPVS